MKNTGKILGALVAGVAIGVVAGILLAPRKGSKTREDLASGLKDMIDKGKEKLSEISEKMSDIISEKKKI